MKKLLLIIVSLSSLNVLRSNASNPNKEANTKLFVCGTSVSAPTTACDNGTFAISGVALGGNTGFFSTNGAGTLVDNFNGTGTYTPVLGETTVDIIFDNNQDNGCTGGQIQAIKVVNLITIPNTPSAITGATNICAGSAGNAYSVVSVGGVTENWTLPSGATINSGNNTANISVTFGNTSGNIAVTASNSCGTSAPSFLNISLNTIPAAPTAISGTTDICINQLSGHAYSTGIIAGATSYTWTLPSGSTFNSGSGTNSIVVNLGSSTGTISVTADNVCGASAAFSEQINILQVPATPSTISGNTLVCQGQNGVSYNVGAVANATNYTWTLMSGATISSGINTNIISVNFDNTANSGNISVVASNAACTSNISPSLFININPSASSIAGATMVCEGSSENYSINPLSNVTYNWNVPIGANILTPNPNQANSILVDFPVGTNNGDVTVSISSTCGTSPIVSTALTISPLPASAGTISGVNAITRCPDNSTQVYSVPTVANATGYTWSIPNNATITAGNNTNQITIVYASNFNGGIITVKGTNTCGNGNNSNQLAITNTGLATQNLCLVTVDDSSRYNIIVWEKPVTTAIDSFKIWRIQTASIDTLVGTVAYENLSEFVDTTCDPNVTQYDYRMSVIDSCGNEGQKSLIHRTILMTTTPGFNQVILNWNQYILNSVANGGVNQYRVWRDDNINNTWTQIATLSPASTTYIDNAFPASGAWRYRIDVDWTNVCTATARTNSSTTNTTRSNTKDNYRLTGLSQLTANNVLLYPNPTSELINLSLNANAYINNINVLDATGRLVKIISATNKNNQTQINTADLARGIYFIEINTNAGIVRKNFVKE